MKRTRLDEEVVVYTLDICSKIGNHTECPGTTTFYAGEIEIGPLACICECHKVKAPGPRSRDHQAS